MAHYFTDETTKAIIEMKGHTDPEIRNQIFVEKIKSAFETMINYHFSRLPDYISKNEELKQDALTDLYEKIDKFNSDKHDRGFPYFNIIVRNFFIQEKKRQDRERLTSENVYSLSDLAASEEPLVDDAETSIQNLEYFVEFKKSLVEWKDFFKKDQEKKFVEALCIVFDNADNLEFHNKKAVYVYLKELTGMNSKQIAANISKLKKKFDSFKKKWHRGDI